VLIARLLPLARTFVSLPARARRVPLGSFVALTTIGCALWALALTLAGVFAASAWMTVDSVLGRALLMVGLVTLAASILRSHKRRSAPTSPDRRDPTHRTWVLEAEGPGQSEAGQHA
jgi:membrane protein DedA with SNARE-associated domain